MNTASLTIGLGVVLLVVLVVPFAVKRAEHNLELFLFLMGVVAVTISALWSVHLLEEALVEPIKITLAVLLAGLAFHYLKGQIRAGVHGIMRRVPFRPFVFSLVVVLGLLSSALTAIIAALILVEVVSAMDLSRKRAVKLVVLACFSIGMGAALTPIGEPLSTIAISKLAGEPYNATFFFLAGLLGKFIVPGIIAAGVLAVLLLGREEKAATTVSAAQKHERLSHVAVRAGKVYLFVVALILLGAGFKPLVDLYFVHIPAAGLYWANSASAILDNATLAAAEISPEMNRAQLTGALISLLIAGAALIPGNIPNIISAGKLKISMKEWASVGVPLALAAMALFFPLVLLAS